MMKLTIALIFAFLSATAVYAEIYNYSCKACVFPRIVSGDGSDGCDVVDGKTYPLRVDDKKNVLEWRGKIYRSERLFITVGGVAHNTYELLGLPKAINMLRTCPIKR